MSQRLDVPFHPYLLDPSTGAPLRAIGILPLSGRVVWPQLGAADDDTETDETEETETDTDDQETETETETDKGTETVSKADFEALFRRMQAADNRASTFEKKVKDYEKAGQTEAEKLQNERDEAKAERDKTAEDLKNTRIENAILALKNAPSWHDPAEAVAILRRSFMEGVEIDGDGKVTGIAEAVKKMAKEKPYLVKTESVSSTTDTMNGQRKGDTKNNTAKTEELKKRFPSLAHKG